jgi:hypothetical protein
MKVNNRDFPYHAYMYHHDYKAEVYQWLINKFDLPYGPRDNNLPDKTKYKPLNPNSNWMFGGMTMSKIRGTTTVLTLCFARKEDLMLFSLSWPVVDINSA